MNFVGKAFVLLILIMSLVFMSFSIMVYATHRNWREAVTNPTAQPGKPLGLKPQMEQEASKYLDLNAQAKKLREDLAREKAFKEQAVAVLESERDVYKAELDKVKTEQVDWQKQLTDASTAAQKANENLAARDAQLTKLNDEHLKVIGDYETQFKKAVESTEQWQQAQAEADRLKALNVQLTDQVAKARLVLRRYGVNEESVAMAASAIKLDGVVLASSANGLVEISLGSDDGIERGLTLEVYRQTAGRSKYLGRVEVLQTMPDKSVAKVIPEFRQGIIEKDDRVATRLN